MIQLSNANSYANHQFNDPKTYNSLAIDQSKNIYDDLDLKFQSHRKLKVILVRHSGFVSAHRMMGL